MRTDVPAWTLLVVYLAGYELCPHSKCEFYFRTNMSACLIPSGYMFLNQSAFIIVFAFQLKQQSGTCVCDVELSAASHDTCSCSIRPPSLPFHSMQVFIFKVDIAMYTCKHTHICAYVWVYKEI